MRDLPKEIKGYLEIILNDDINIKNERIKQSRINSILRDAKTLFNLFLSNPAKRENLTSSISIILENNSFIVFSDFCSTEKTFTIKGI